MARGVQKTNYY